MIRHAAIAAVVALLLMLPAATATATATATAGEPVATATSARVCCPGSPSGELENFGGYVLKGTVEPSRKAQIVRFSYRRPKADRWRPFKVAGEDGVSGTGFFVLGREGPRDRLSRDDRFRTDFTPSVAPGRWLIRAVFPAQDGFARSADIVRVEVAGSD